MLHLILKKPQMWAFISAQHKFWFQRLLQWPEFTIQLTQARSSVREQGPGCRSQGPQHGSRHLWSRQYNRSHYPVQDASREAGAHHEKLPSHSFPRIKGTLLLLHGTRAQQPFLPPPLSVHFSPFRGPTGAHPQVRHSSFLHNTAAETPT